MIIETIANELNVQKKQVDAAVNLLDEGATVPFIARYRKEATGGLDDTQLRTLAERLSYLRELLDRKGVILKSIEAQGKLDDALKKIISDTMSKAELEDIYLPYKPKRRTKAQIAIEAGLLPLADEILANPDKVPEELAKGFINTEYKINEASDALDGAKQILMERFSESADVRKTCRSLLWDHGILKCGVLDKDKPDAAKFADYFDYEEPIAKIPSHRALAIFRGRKQEVLKSQLVLPEAITTTCIKTITEAFSLHLDEKPGNKWLVHVVDWTWKIKLHTKLEIDCLLQLKEQSEKTAIDVFAENLKNLLLASPAGSKVTMGLDPGFRTGVKMVVVDETGKLVHFETIFPHPPQKQFDDALHKLYLAAKKYNVNLISIGNGTASRETDQLVAALMKKHPELGVSKIIVSESGASVYSASELAAKEFPKLDVSYRGAVSIARRLQDPLAELVKIDPKAIGVGQYQHDVNQVQLAKSLDGVVEDCVNKVGVDVNMASAALLAHISGLNQQLANNIVAYRDEHGRFSSREVLKSVPRMGEKTFQQAAGFLRITEGDNPLDASSVHPESYSVVDAITTQKSISTKELIGNADVLKKLVAKDFVTDDIGMITVKDIISELNKPGRDPRPDFVMPTFDDAITTMNDLEVGMQLEGVVSNVTHFGAFVDLGVHQDGLVHKSVLSDKYIENPHDVVKVGDIVNVTVVSVDIDRKRIGLSMCSERKGKGQGQRQPSQKQHTYKKSTEKPKTALAEAFAALGK